MEYVFVYIRPNIKMPAQLPPPFENDTKNKMFDDYYLDYLYAAMSLMRFVLLGVS